ncbi:MAG: sulfotransferase [Lamprocystis purpurea]|jgi:hypothetical protein|uniref:sulfotransferase n=1 Tax=Lamprocystis purpurea TaxID=61598 RepID=UPI0003652577|nr:sulfotransferase [Lamprocystis purpurea]MBV5273912.1 sulfotransferase [Lamprocystis purpurea]
MPEIESLPIVFLIGAGRSGTTLLYKTLSLHQNVAYLSNYHNKYPHTILASGIERVFRRYPGIKLKSWFKDDGSAYFNRARELYIKAIPQPAECESVYQRCGVPITPADRQDVSAQSRECLRRTFREIFRYTGGAVLLSKRTANNRRIGFLQSIFPEAKFVHLVRDGRGVAYSLLRVNWWADHILFWSGMTPSQMLAQGEDAIDLAARNWVEEMKYIEQGLAGVAATKVCELRYEDFLAHPHAQLDSLLRFMGVEPSTDTHYRASVDALMLKPEKVKWMTAWTDEQKARVLSIQKDTLARTGYL